MTQITAAMVKELREQTGAGMMDAKAALTEAEGNMEQAVVILRKKGLAAAGKKAGRVTAEGTVQAYVEGSKGVLVEVNCETDFVGRNENFKSFADEVARVIAQSNATTVEQLLAENWPGTNEPVSQKVAEKIGSIKENITIRRFARYESTDGVIGTYIHGGGKIGVMVEVTGSNREHAAEVAKDVAMHIAAAEPRFLRREDVTEKDLATEREIALDAALKSGKPQNIAEKIAEGKMNSFFAERVLLDQEFFNAQVYKGTVGNMLKQAGLTLEKYVRLEVGQG